ncbi:uncharacterized protein LOC121680513 [Alosa sapidissima]|uniref:uncharacterized protein LOC121680513 n=1 Tax=Alosa sapidissima TaxID=34773 RepID=UPI001C094E48|nr:uncharacterized protein LOC121680513 [Alosa sapidissima]
MADHKWHATGGPLSSNLILLSGDQGHLNPNSFHCEKDGRIATFTLINAAPMDACFNCVHGKDWEKGVKDILNAEQPGAGTAYLVTGTVVDVSQDYRIPRRGEFGDDSTREYHSVTVPTHIWTAVCYKHNVDDEKSFSFGYIGKNQPDSNQILLMSDDALNTFHTATSQFNDKVLHPLKRPKVTEMTILESFDSLETWFKTTEIMKYICLGRLVYCHSQSVPS